MALSYRRYFLRLTYVSELLHEAVAFALIRIIIRGYRYYICPQPSTKEGLPAIVTLILRVTLEATVVVMSSSIDGKILHLAFSFRLSLTLSLLHDLAAVETLRLLHCLDLAAFALLIM